jgi:hypothetical protein
MLPYRPSFSFIALIFLAVLTSVLGDWPPLHKAAYEGDVDTAKALVSSGALLNQKDSKCVTCSELTHSLALLFSPVGNKCNLSSVA